MEALAKKFGYGKTTTKVTGRDQCVCLATEHEQ